MRIVLCFATVMLLLTASAFADNGNVRKSTLADLGLAGADILSDDEGMEIRGLSGNAAARGISLVTGLLLDPNSLSFVVGIDTNGAASSAENAGINILTKAAENQASAIDISLSVMGTSIYNGILIGGAGGSAMGSSH